MQRWAEHDRYGNLIYMNESFEYDEESDVLEVFFGTRRRSWTIELTPNIMISIDRTAQEVTSLIFLDYSELIRHVAWGVRSFPITGLADLPSFERQLVSKLLSTPAVRRWLDLSTVENLPDSPFTVTHLQSPPPEVGNLIFAPA